MPIGPGKYDAACTRAREESKAECVVLIVLSGTLGSGFSVQTENLDMLAALPGILRSTAKQIEASAGEA